jgi:serine/threonine protein kinase
VTSVASASSSITASVEPISSAVSDSGSGYVDPTPALVANGSVSPRLSMSPSSAQTWTIDSAELELGGVLGEGAFGVVRSGKWRGRTVAIKQIKQSAIGGEKALAEFELEIGRMAALQPHENVVQLYGVVHLPGGDVGAVVEFCASGALVSALYGAKPRQWLERELTQVAYDSACGIMHLHANNVIHRDIAARNVLLAGRVDLVAKVADFGMSRSIEAAQGYNELATGTKIGPAKHMAPEQLQRLAYSKATDVFAFAVLLFEIFAREEPWKNVPPINAITKVIAGERMVVPASASAVVRSLMEQCWAQDPAQRPHMRAVCKVLEEEMTRQNLGN